MCCTWVSEDAETDVVVFGRNPGWSFCGMIEECVYEAARGNCEERGGPGVRRRGHILLYRRPTAARLHVNSFYKMLPGPTKKQVMMLPGPDCEPDVRVGKEKTC
jgi:hypothetical protein